MSNYHILSRSGKGEVGIINDKYIVKIRPKGRLDHEYYIGLKLNELGSPHFIQTISLTPHPTRRDTDVLRLSKASGISATEFLWQNPKSYLLFVRHLILIISDVAQRVGFNHNDLHLDNILVVKTHLKRYNYLTHIGEKSIVSPYHITIIDYEFSRIDDVKDEWACIGPDPLVAGLIPSVRDDFSDLIFIAIRYLVMEGVAPKFNDIAVRYGFQPFIRQKYKYFCGRGNNPDLNIIFDKNLIISKAEPKFYLANSYSDIKLTDFIDRVYSQLGLHYGLDPKDRNCINCAAVDDPTIAEYKITIQIVFGRIMKRIKQEQVQARPHAVREILMAFDEFFS